ncbi:hypothetical protein K2173_017256 [Erythroxylum novogranatense]|uniref:Alkaline phytoceramidase n=1 Tax=Erythroxylum novogranatense TaxID=1862640 RepID=A0AAV8UA18_9ROSI|nr:hypothetical protein K2173_017256 [Erythroxylum novogranatense]
MGRCHSLLGVSHVGHSQTSSLPQTSPLRRHAQFPRSYSVSFSPINYHFNFCFFFFMITVTVTGVPNTLNVITNFPFLIVGVVGFILSLQGCLFNISLRGEVWGWTLFFAGIVGMSFGSAYYHLKPDDARIMWDALPMMIAYSSLLSCFMVERLGQRIGLSCLFGLLLVVLLSMVYARTFNDLRLCMLFQLIPCIVIPGLAFLYPAKYTHSKYWLWAAGVCILSKFEAAFDRKIYNANRYFISGHSLEHLCSAVVPVLLAIMLLYRNTRHQRLGDIKERP